MACFEEKLQSLVAKWQDWRLSQIKQAAYFAWLDSGCPANRDLDFWLDAERKWWLNTVVEVDLFVNERGRPLDIKYADTIQS